VEDSEADAELTRTALRKRRLFNPLHVVDTGQAALDFLYRRGAHVDAPRPVLVLLDLNLPGLDGHDVLRVMKEDPDLRRIPVVVLTSSPHELDVRRAYDAHANSYIVKPVDFHKFVDAVSQISDYWFELVVKAPA
jgi:two-component system response regulator